jgi:carboxyl-terminal processing protease
MDFEHNVSGQEQVPHKNFFQSHRRLFSIIVLVVIIAGSFGAGWKIGNKGFVYKPKEFKIVNQKDQPQAVDYQLLWDTLDVLNKKFIDKPIDQQKILYGAVSGAVAAVGDPYTVFMPPKELQNFQTQLKGNFDGIGAEIGQKDGNIVIVAPLDGMPAQKAGLLAKDIIAQVDGQSTAGWSTEQAVDHIRGVKGTQVTLTILRSGKDKPFDVKITRDNIVIKSVKWKYQDVNGKKIAIITISQFGDDTEALFNQAVNDILTKNVSGIIVDLRNDPGGYLQTAVNIASNWVEAGKTVVTEAHSDGTTEVYAAIGNTRLANIKTMVMINGGSASAAEILSGALRDYNLAKLIGEKSFGKGSVQELVDLRGGAAVKVTVAKWITPNGKNLNKDGLNPDIEVKLTESDINAGKDPQMDSALQQITK